MKTLKILVFMMFVMVSMGFGQEYNENDYYDNGEYAEYDDENLSYDYGYDNARDYLERYNGPVYYWGHPQRDVYFVLIGSRVFVIPMVELSSIWNRLHWSLVSMDRFIHLSCFGLPYYDNYMRFNYYFNHYRHYGYGSYYNRYLRTRYRRYFRDRRHNRDYYRYRSRVLNNRKWNRNRRYRSTIPRRKIVRERLDTRKRAIRNSPATRRYSSRRTTKSRTYGSSGSSSRSRINNSDRRVIRRDSVRRSTSKRSTSVRRPARRSTSSSVRRSRSSRKSSSNRSSTKSRSKSRRR